jgi:hypothetical protein
MFGDDGGSCDGFKDGGNNRHDGGNLMILGLAVGMVTVMVL